MGALLILLCHIHQLGMISSTERCMRLNLHIVTLLYVFGRYGGTNVNTSHLMLQSSPQPVPSIGTSRMQSLGHTILMQPEWRQRMSFWHIHNFTSLPVIILCPRPRRSPRVQRSDCHEYSASPKTKIEVWDLFPNSLYSRATERLQSIIRQGRCKRIIRYRRYNYVSPSEV